MAANEKEVQHQCRYVGTNEQNAARCIEQKPVPPPAEFARTIVLEILGGHIGKYQSCPHFRERMEERDFDVLDIEYAVRNGTCIKGGEYCEDSRNFKYTFRGNLEGTDFDATFALSADHEFIRSPLLILITGCFKTATGRRKKTY